MFNVLEARYGRRCGASGVRAGAGFGAEVDQREDGEMKQKYSIGQPARIVGKSPASAICGVAFRGGVIVYALVGVAGVWPSWVVEAA